MVTLADTRYQIIQRRDERYDEVFFFAVKTTGIYCRPSCAARRPLPQNCLFFSSTQDAEKGGFRACKRCRPNEPKVNSVETILHQLKEGYDTAELATNFQLTDRHLRRLVKQATGTTPFRLEQLRRLQLAKNMLLRTDLPVITIAFQTDFSSVRQFNYAFKQAYGYSPRQIRHSQKGVSR